MTTTSNQDIIDTLRRTLALFNDGANWAQGQWAIVPGRSIIDQPDLLTCDPTVTCFCLQGALGFATGHDPACNNDAPGLFSQINLMLDDVLNMDVTDWNDAEDREYHHVEELLLGLIDQLEMRPTFPGWEEV